MGARSIRLSIDAYVSTEKSISVYMSEAGIMRSWNIVKLAVVLKLGM